jgi:2-pyrone-4,6-dicarboxylate lactonase
MNASAPLPEGACDAHFHVFDDPMRYPISHAAPLYEPPNATIERLLAMHKALGIERGVLVHPHVYGRDFTLLLDFLKQAPAGSYRGIAMVDDTVDDKQLETLHAAGVRGARFHFQDRFGSTLSLAEFRRSVARIAELGWIVKIFARGTELQELEDELRGITSPVLLDHLGRLDFAKGISQDAFKVVVGLLRRDNWWILLSNGDVRDEGPVQPWSDAIPFGRTYYETAPERCIWGSDWPHIAYNRRGLEWPDEKALVGLLESFLPDQAARRAVLVDNPARLFGFSS